MAVGSQPARVNGHAQTISKKPRSQAMPAVTGTSHSRCPNNFPAPVPRVAGDQEASRCSASNPLAGSRAVSRPPEARIAPPLHTPAPP